jgi:hypothetical protein
MYLNTYKNEWPFSAGNTYFTYTTEGAVAFDKLPSENDLIAEWQEGPVRTVTRKEIVPGWYGIVRVTNMGDVSIPAPGQDPAQLRAAAATLIEIADALEEQT